MSAGFLWEKGKIQRYRINVWQTTYQDGRFCPDTKIIHSYFVFYYPDEQMIVDKTIEPEKKDKDLLGRIREMSKQLNLFGENLLDEETLLTKGDDREYRRGHFRAVMGI